MQTEITEQNGTTQRSTSGQGRDGSSTWSGVTEPGKSRGPYSIHFLKAPLRGSAFPVPLSAAGSCTYWLCLYSACLCLVQALQSSELFHSCKEQNQDYDYIIYVIHLMSEASDKHNKAILIHSINR